MRVCGGADANRLISPNPHAPETRSHFLAGGNTSLGIKNISGDVLQRLFIAEANQKCHRDHERVIDLVRLAPDRVYFASRDIEETVPSELEEAV